MDTKQLYKDKLAILRLTALRIEGLRGDLARLTGIEAGFPAPDHGDLYGINVAIDELSDLVEGLTSAVEPSAE
jgi:hypothetical protein